MEMGMTTGAQRSAWAIALTAGLLASAPVYAERAVSVTKEVTPNPAVAGQPVTWTLRVLNEDPGPVANVKLADTLPAGVTNIRASGDGFACTVTGLTVGCLAKEIPVGLTVVTIHGIAPGAPAVSSAQTIKPRTGTITPRGQALPDGIMDTVANLKLTIGSLEKERDALSSKLQVAESETSHARGEVTRLGSALDVAQSAQKDLQDKLARTQSEMATLKGDLDGGTSDRAALASELASTKSALDAAQSEVAKLQASVTAKQSTIDQLTQDLTTVRTQLVMAEPLQFNVDCPAEATSQKWLIGNLPILLDAAMANPTQRNTRSFLCAQRAATSGGDFARRDQRSFVPARPVGSVTDGKLHTHTVFQGPPSADALRELRSAAESGSAQALNDWGVLVLVGEGTPQDIALGYRYIEAAAKAGSGIAATNLAVMFDRGVGVEQNQATASQWRRMAAVLNGGSGS